MQPQDSQANPDGGTSSPLSDEDGTEAITHAGGKKQGWYSSLDERIISRVSRADGSFLKFDN